MMLFPRYVLLLLQIVFLTSLEAKQDNSDIPSRHVSHETWSQVRPFLLPEQHPIKAELDKIFLHSRAFENKNSMLAAGFLPAEPQHHTQIIVTRHPALPGFVIKAYWDNQNYHSGQPEHYFWVKRITGAHLIHDFIQSHNFDHRFKVPEKWIYLLPDEPSPPSELLRKMFILVEKDMDIFDDAQNRAMWRSEWVTPHLLDDLHHLLTSLGLRDCAKIDNCPFSRDGRIAFVDTQSFQKKSVKYKKLSHFLTPKMRSYWHGLFKKEKNNVKILLNPKM